MHEKGRVFDNVLSESLGGVCQQCPQRCILIAFENFPCRLGVVSFGAFPWGLGFDLSWWGGNTSDVAEMVG